MIRRHLSLIKIPSIFVAIAALYIGVIGIISADFGHHWDEKRIVKAVEKSAQTGVLLPRWYNYPSLSYDISLITAVPGIVHAALNADSHRSASRKINKYLSSQSYKTYL